MEINTNISSQVASSIAKLHISATKRAFEESKKEVQQQPIEEEIIPKTPNKSSIDIEDIQKYANYMGENLSIDDINYGLRYGRSVIADYLA